MQMHILLFVTWISNKRLFNNILTSSYIYFTFQLYCLNSYNWPFEGNHNTDVALGKNEFDTIVLDCSGWTNALTRAGIATAGTAKSFIRVSHLKRTRHAHQVTVVTLPRLEQDAFEKNLQEENSESIDLWRLSMLE